MRPPSPVGLAPDTRPVAGASLELPRLARSSQPAGGFFSAAMTDNPWTPERIEQLRALWAEGLSINEIGRRMKMSKNAVIGKAHRLKLAARPSPIRRGGEPKVAKARPVPKPAATLPPLEVVVPEVRRTNYGDLVPAVGRGAYRAALAAPTLPDVAAAPVARPVAVGPSSACCWPLSDGRPWLFCEAASAPGRSYCPAHMAMAYQRGTVLSDEERERRSITARARNLKSGFMLVRA